jgi:biotin/methionine sulfoxide reductase
MTAQLVRNHSHWGAFFAQVENGRVVGVRPFEHDPDPSDLIEAIPAAVHSPTRVAGPMVREGWLAGGGGNRRAADTSRSSRYRGIARSTSCPAKLRG